MTSLVTESSLALSPTHEPEVLFEADGLEARPLVLSPVKMAFLWDRMSQFPVLFATGQVTSFPAFRDIMEDRDTVLLAFEKDHRPHPVGLGMVYGITAPREAKIQVSFFDSKLKGREAFIRGFIGWVFDTFEVWRISVHIRGDAHWLGVFFERVGLYFEGALKHWIRKDGQLYDLYLYGLTERECDEQWRLGHSWAKPRVRMVSDAVARSTSA